MAEIQFMDFQANQWLLCISLLTNDTEDQVLTVCGTSWLHHADDLCCSPRITVLVEPVGTGSTPSDAGEAELARRGVTIISYKID